MTDPRKPFADALRAAGLDFNRPGVVEAFDAMLDKAGVARAGKLATSGEGIDLIKRFEGLKLAAYPDPGSGGEPWTIGIGTTIYPDGRKVRPGDVITEAQAEEYLALNLRGYEAEVAKAIGDAPTSQTQFDALVSFHYNTGAIARATLTKLHRAGKFEAAASEFAKWNKSNGKVMRGLVRRRAAEAALYRRGSQ